MCRDCATEGGHAGEPVYTGGGSYRVCNALLWHCLCSVRQHACSLPKALSKLKPSLSARALVLSLSARALVLELFSRKFLGHPGVVHREYRTLASLAQRKKMQNRNIQEKSAEFCTVVLFILFY